MMESKLNEPLYNLTQREIAIQKARNIKGFKDADSMGTLEIDGVSFTQLFNNNAESVFVVVREDSTSIYKGKPVLSYLHKDVDLTPAAGKNK